MKVCNRGLYLYNFCSQQSLGVREEYYVLACYEASSPTFFWQISIFVYLAILQVVGILLAFQTRHVKIKGLNESKLVATIIYISSVVLVALALVNFGLRTYINIGTGITVAGIFTLTTIILGLNFVPKVCNKVCLYMSTVICMTDSTLAKYQVQSIHTS